MSFNCIMTIFSHLNERQTVYLSVTCELAWCQDDSCERIALCVRSDALYGASCSWQATVASSIIIDACKNVEMIKFETNFVPIITERRFNYAFSVPSGSKLRRNNLCTIPIIIINYHNFPIISAFTFL